MLADISSSGRRKGSLYVDEGKQSVFPLMNGQQMGLLSKGVSMLSGLGSYLWGGTVAQAAARAHQQSIEGNMEGEGLLRGGVWVSEIHAVTGAVERSGGLCSGD